MSNFAKSENPDLHALAQALADARAAEARARQDRLEVLSEPAFQPAFTADAYARLAIENARNHAAAIENDLRTAIEQHYAETGEGPGVDGLGIQWRSEPVYEDTRALLWLGAVLASTDLSRDALLLFDDVDNWLREAIAKHRPALNRLILEYRPPFADTSSKKLVPTISDQLNVKLNPINDRLAEARAIEHERGLQEVAARQAEIETEQARDRREHSEAITKLVAENWGTKP